MPLDTQTCGRCGAGPHDLWIFFPATLTAAATKSHELRCKACYEPAVQLRPAPIGTAMEAAVVALRSAGLFGREEI